MGIDILIISAFVILGVLLLMAEIFLLPGLTVAGFAGVGSLIGAIVYAFIYVGNEAGYITLGVSIVVTVGTFVYLVKSKAMDRIALTTDVDSKVDISEVESIQKGDKGVAESRLNPIGSVNFDGTVVEAKSIDGEYISEGTVVEAVKIESNILVRRVAKEENQ